MEPAALKTPWKMLPDMAWPGGQKFSGRTKTFNTIAEKFYPRIKIFGGTFFLDSSCKLLQAHKEVCDEMKKTTSVW